MREPSWSIPGVALHVGDCLDVLKEMPDASVDAICTDPPYGLTKLTTPRVLEAIAAWMSGDRDHVPDARGFMGREWDAFVPPPGVWDECLRVLKPGGHLVAFAAPRTVDLMTLSIRIAGFEIRDQLEWIFGGGFPKGQDVAKAIDRRREDRAEVLQVTTWLRDQRDAAGWTTARMDALFGFNGMAGHWTATVSKAAAVPTPEQWDRLREELGFDDADVRSLVAKLNGRKGVLGESWAQREVVAEAYRVRRPSDVQIAGLSDGAYDVTAPAREEARRWEGWNTSLKPAHEPIVLARKSTGFNTTVANVLEHGTGALNIGACRVEPTGESRPRVAEASQETRYTERGGTFAPLPGVRGGAPEGRWPANLVFTHSASCIEGYECDSGCSVAELDRQSGVTTSSGGVKGGQIGVNATFGKYEHNGPRANAGGLGDRGGASRYFPVFRYEAKAPASERPKLPDGTAWPTVKPLALMSWLVRLITPPGGTVLDPFAGTGTTGEAAIVEGFRSVLIERDPSAVELIKTRLSKPIAPTLDLFGEETSHA